MRLQPFSWFSDWADKLGISVVYIWVAAFAVGFLLLSWLGIFGARLQLPQLIELFQQNNGG